MLLQITFMLEHAQNTYNYEIGIGVCPLNVKQPASLTPLNTTDAVFNKKEKKTDSKAVLYSLHNKAETFKLAKENERNTKRSAKIPQQFYSTVPVP